MRYQTDNKYRKYAEGYGFLSFETKFGNKCGKKLMDTAINTKNIYSKKINDTTKKEVIKFTKTSGRRILDKSAIATGDLIVNKIADKITSLGNKPKREEINEQQQKESVIPPEKKTTNY